MTQYLLQKKTNTFVAGKVTIISNTQVTVYYNLMFPAIQFKITYKYEIVYMKSLS